jgi:DNA-directed RNA polymerase specialized sigma24 family protein
LQVTVNTQQRPDPSKWLDSHGDYLYRYALVRVRDASVAEDFCRKLCLQA